MQRTGTWKCGHGASKRRYAHHGNSFPLIRYGERLPVREAFQNGDYYGSGTMPCPSKVSIPECFEVYNQGCMFVVSVNYNVVMGGMLTESPGFASQCEDCGECEEKCSQGVVVYFGK